MYEPEQRLEPPEDDYVTADCGHEIYRGGTLYTWENGKTLCEECLKDKFDELSINEKADLIGVEHTEVTQEATRL